MNAQAIPATRIVPGSDEWRTERRKYLGASDAPAALGYSPWGKPIDVCLDKWGESPDIENDAMRRGTLLENVVALAYAIRTGAELTPEEHFVHPSIPFMAATPDRGIAGEKKHVQIKTHIDFTLKFHDYGETGTDQLPQHEIIQVCHELAVTGNDEVDVAILFASDKEFSLLVSMIESEADETQLATIVEANMDLRIYTIQRDKRLEEVLIREERKFWENYVLTHEIPEFDGSDSVKEYLLRKYPSASATVRDATEDEEKLVLMYRALKEEADALDLRMQASRQRVIDAIGDDLGIAGEFGTVKYGNAKGRKTTAWKKVVEEAAVDQKIIAKNTKEGKPSRRFTSSWN